MKTLIFLAAILSYSALALTQAEKEQFHSANLYTRLGLSKTAKEAEVKSAFRRLAMKLHPDKNPGDAEAELAFKKINEANEILSKSEKRAVYDQRPDVDSVGSAPSAANDKYDWDYQKEMATLKQVAIDYPELAAIVDIALKEHIFPYLPDRPAFLMLPDPIELWPSDMALVEAMIATRNPFLLRSLAFNILTLPSWEEHPEVLRKIAGLNIPFVNDLVAELMYEPDWVNAKGAAILQLLVKIGYADHVLVSLGMSVGYQIKYPNGTVKQASWAAQPEGAELMAQAILHASPAALKRLDHFQFDTESAPWVKCMRTIPGLSKLPYLTSETMKPVLEKMKPDCTLRLTARKKT